MESYYAIKILNSIIIKNEKIKTILLEIPFEILNGKITTYFFETIIIYMIETIESNNNYLLSSSFIMLIINWINNSQDTLLRFIENNNYILKFIDFIFNDNLDFNVRFLSFFLLSFVSFNYKNNSKRKIGFFFKKN
jgi:hypothetical protein